jgi:hypothetical protein
MLDDRSAVKRYVAPRPDTRDSITRDQQRAVFERVIGQHQLAKYHRYHGASHGDRLFRISVLSSWNSQEFRLYRRRIRSHATSAAFCGTPWDFGLNARQAKA